MSHWLRFVSLLALKVVRAAKAGSALAFLSLMVLPTNDHTLVFALPVMIYEAMGCPLASCLSWVLAATILGSSIAFIDGSVVTVALPAIQTDLATSVAGAQWIVKGYMLMSGALILVGGAAGDRFGRRRVFAWALLSSRPRPLAAAWRPASQF